MPSQAVFGYALMHEPENLPSFGPAQSHRWQCCDRSRRQFIPSPIYVGELAYEQGKELTSLRELNAVADDLCWNWKGVGDEELWLEFICKRVGKTWQMFRLPRPVRVSIPVEADMALTVLRAFAGSMGE